MTDPIAFLIAFLNARLDEDEATASYAGPARIAWLTYRDADGQMLYTTVAAGEDHAPWVADGKELPPPASARVVYDPARVLREVEAGRHLTAEYRRALEKAPGNLPLLNTLRRLIGSRVAVYSDHPDYNPAWRPAP